MILATSRKRQFEPGEPEHPIGKLDMEAILAVKELGICTQKQIEKLLGWTYKQGNSHLRNPYDHKFLRKFEVDASAFADPTKTRNRTAGKAPHIYALSQKGIDELVTQKYAEKDQIYYIRDYDDTNSHHVAHLIEIRNFRVWLELLKRAYPEHGGAYHWTCEPTCHIDLGRKVYPKEVRPDAVVTYRMKGDDKVLCLLETDRGTEPDETWETKHIHYATLFNTQHEAKSELDVVSRGRLVVIVPNTYRREKIYTTLSKIPPERRITKPNRIWIADKSVLERTDLAEPIWRVVGQNDFMPFLPAHAL